MAKMQLEVERVNNKVSCFAETVSIVQFTVKRLVVFLSDCGMLWG